MLLIFACSSEYHVSLIIFSGNFVSGDKIVIAVTANYEVGSFSGTKALLITTIGASAGKNKSVGIAYITAGTLFLVFGVLQVLKEYFWQ